MAAIDSLITQIQDSTLRRRIQEEVNRLNKQKTFGLVFEKHIPEATPLYDMPIKKGSNVSMRDTRISDIYRVRKIEGDIAECIHSVTKETSSFPVKDLVCVAQFGEPIYPYLKPIDSVCNAPDSDLWHTLIEADNYHALQLLEYLYAGKVDCIYIDPPYNTGAKDWKYNNNYVDGNDAYRHSKWLSFMERRLKLAKKLLRPQKGVLIVAIDDNELHTLGMLLSELFPEYDPYCITIIHNPNGNQGHNFGITNEFCFFLLPTRDQILSLEDRKEDPDIRPLRDVSGNSNMRTDAKNCFYPILIKDKKIVGFGDVCPDDFHPISANVPMENGVIAVYPIDTNGNEKKWVFARQSVESIFDELRVEWNSSRKIYDIIRYKTHFTYKSVWDKKAYNANSYGSKMINSILACKRFDYPKSLYAVEECIRAVCKSNPHALVLDFFAGSGTTLHAVNLLNAEDGGHRRCIMVTNNEVSEAEAKQLRSKGYKPGDEEWERLGIARYVTWPRTVCSIKGYDVNGNPLKGKYLGSGIPMSDGFKANAVYFKLGFLDKDAVSLGMQFKELLPVIWMKAGAVGPCPSIEGEVPDMMILSQNRMAVLVDESESYKFISEVAKHPKIETVFIVTDSEDGFHEMSTMLNVKKTYQLYRDYLDNFKITWR